MKKPILRPERKPRTLLTEKQVLRQLHSMKKSGMTYAEIGSLAGIGSQFACDMLRGRKPICDGMLQALGLRRVELYTKEGA